MSFFLFFVLAVAAGRAQVQQEPRAQTREGTGIDIACSHPNIQSNAYIHWYRQFPGQGPSFLVRAYSGSQDVTDPVGRLSVAGDRRSSTLNVLCVLSSEKKLSSAINRFLLPSPLS
uniref:Immunoglobulin V-set domain-containing protein n=1 Tax=Anas platyrhynchos platyrhynchos TaxID=8840 RepID=U3HYM4_ANAPP